METHQVTVRSLRVLRGPNLFAYMPVLHAVMDIGPYDERPSSSFPGFVDRLVAWLPTLHKHECSVGRPGGFIERLHRGTYLGHIVEHIITARDDGRRLPRREAARIRSRCELRRG